jgi:hypothetical protein
MRFIILGAAAIIACGMGSCALGSPTATPINLHAPTVSCPGFNYLTVEPLTMQGHAAFFLNGTLLSRYSWTDKAWFHVPLPGDILGTNLLRVDFSGGQSISKQFVVLPHQKMSSDRFPQVRTVVEASTLQMTKRFHPEARAAYLESFICTAPRQLVGFIRDDNRRVEDIATLRQYQGQWILIDYGPVEKHEKEARRLLLMLSRSRCSNPEFLGRSLGPAGLASHLESIRCQANSCRWCC